MRPMQRNIVMAMLPILADKMTDDKVVVEESPEQFNTPIRVETKAERKAEKYRCDTIAEANQLAILKEAQRIIKLMPEELSLEKVIILNCAKKYKPSKDGTIILPFETLIGLVWKKLLKDYPGYESDTGVSEKTRDARISWLSWVENNLKKLKQERETPIKYNASTGIVEEKIFS